MLFIQCQDNFTCERRLTLGKYYKVLKYIPGSSPSTGSVLIKADTNRQLWFSIGFFKRK